MKKIIFVSLVLVFTQLSYGNPMEYNEELLSKLSLREKIGQLCIVASIINEERDQEVIKGWYDWQPDYHLEKETIAKLIQEQHVGGIIFYGKNALPQDLFTTINHYQSLSEIPLLITIDAEVGLGSRLASDSVLRFPYNMTLGAIQNTHLIYEAAFEVGQQLKSLGVHVNFAPVIDVNTNPNNPVIGMRSFSSDKERVAELGILYMKGLEDAGIMACAKHFPGHGDTTVDSHLALPRIDHSREYLESNELYPFQRLIDAGVKSIMTAHLEVPALEKEKGLPSSLSKPIVDDLLQKQMGFEGLIITDALGMKGAADFFKPGEIELKALQAGNDVLLCPTNVVKVIDRVEKAVKDGEISEEEIDKKVLKIFQTKQAYLKSHNNPDLNRLLSPETKKLRKTLFQKAMTCIKTDREESYPAHKTLVINTDKNLIEFEKEILSHPIFEYREEALKEESSNRFSYIKKLWSKWIKESAISHVILSVSKNSFDKKEDVAFLVKRIDQLKEEGKNVTLLLFCDPYFVPLNLNADKIILAYEPEPDAQLAAVEVLTGKIIAEGQLI